MLISTNKFQTKINIAKVGKREMIIQEVRQKSKALKWTLSALNFVVGVGVGIATGGLSAGKTAAIQVGIEAMFATAETIIDYSQGVRGGALAMNWIGVATTGLMGGFKAAKEIGKSGVNVANQLANQLASQQSKLASQIDNLVAGVEHYGSQLFDPGDWADDIVDLAIERGVSTSVAAQMFKETAMNTLNELNMELTKLTGQAMGTTIISNAMSGAGNEILTQSLISGITSGLTDDVWRAIKNSLPDSISSSIKQILISGVNLNSSELYSLVLGELNRQIKLGLVDGKMVLSFINNILNISDDVGKELIKKSTLQWAMATKHLFSKSYNKVLQQTIASSKTVAKEIIQQGSSKTIKESLSKGLSKTAKAVGWLDPNTAARRVVNIAFKNINKVIKAWFPKVVKVVKTVQDAKKLYIETGGLAFDSDWIMGYKIISNANTFKNKHLVMISFIQETTNRKTPILAILTDKQLIEWNNAPSKGEWYLDNIALSRGGKSLGLNTLFGAGIGKSKITQVMTSPASQALLSFLPVKAIREVLQITTTLSKNIELMRQGKYFENWVPRFLNSAKNSLISRSINTLTNTIGGRVASSYLGNTVGRVVGREMNRFSQSIIVGGLRQVNAGKSFTNNLGKRLVSSGTSIVRKQANTAIKKYNPSYSNTLKDIRKVRTITRLPNAVVGTSRKMINTNKVKGLW